MAKTINIFNSELEPNVFEIIDGIESVRQRVEQRLKFFRGEWFLDTSKGTPWFQDVLIRPVSAALSAAIITKAIQSVTDVTSVNNVIAEIDPATRKMSYTARVQTIFGSFTVTG